MAAKVGKRTASPSLPQLRLVGQHLLASALTTPMQAARALLAVQAQDFPGAKFSLGLRARGSTDADVEAAITKRAIVRSWPMRGTLHFTVAEDLHWLLALTTPRLLAGARKRSADLGLDERVVERAREVASSLLGGGKSLTRDALLAAFRAHGISTDGQRGYHVLWHLAQTGSLCFGPTHGKQHTFVLLDEWVKRPRRLDRDAALGELARRYFEGHGPASLRDLVRWAGITVADAKQGIAVAARELSELESDGTMHWMAADLQDRAARAEKTLARSVLALPGFDEYVLGYHDRSAVLPVEHAHRIVPGGNGMFMASIVVGGQIVGTWRRAPRRKEILVEAIPFTRIPAWAKAGFARAVRDYGRFVGTPARVVEAIAEPELTGRARDRG